MKGRATMGSLLDGIRKVCIGRRQNRFSVTDTAMVIVTPGENQERKAPILDIGKGGLAFVYNWPQGNPLESGTLQLLANNVVFMDKVNFETASDIPLHETGGQYRRRGVKFTCMGVFDDVKLDNFIREIRTFEL